MSQSVSITQRIKIFNKIYKEMHDDLIEDSNIKYDKIKKYNLIYDFNKQISENINTIIEGNVIELSKNVKLLKKYSAYIKEKSENNKENKDIIFNYIKNLYYVTFENKEEADKISELLDMDLTGIMGSLFNSGSGNKLMKFATELAEELKPLYEGLEISNLENVDIQSLIQDALKGNINPDSISKNLSDTDKEKLEKLIKIIKEKISEKIQSGDLDINELKKMLKKSLKM
jgi:hypothetical protein